MPAGADSLFILADDLSGAADCAMGAARAGLKSIVLLEAGAAAEAEVIAMDADTRHRPAAQARALQADLWRRHAAPGRLLYKKIDSTLRGNFAAEMAGLTGAGLAIVAPAFPATGRTTRNGRVLVKGVPLERTEIWANEHMRGEADIVAMLEAQGLAAIHLPLSTVRGDLRAELARIASEGRLQAVVCDAEEDADLAAIAAASVGLPAYWVGSAGLAAQLPRAAGLQGHAGAPALAVTGPILTVVGSLSAVSRHQSEVLAAHAELTVFVPAPPVLRAGEAHPQWQALRAEVAAALAAGRDVLVRTGLEEHNDLSHGHVLCESLGRLLRPMAGEIGALVATGGETARALLPPLGAHALQLVRDIEPGVPLSVAIGTRPIPVVTKAGAFGSPDALRNCHAALSAIRRGAAA